MATVNPKRAKSQPCAECGVDREVLRRLRKRLESSEQQNLKLSAECNKLREELSEAKFRARPRSVSYIRAFTSSFNSFWLSLSRQSPPSLPNEILHRIFSFATRLEGDLVSPHWRLDDP
jgi:hypothetical protein